jgi:hypothetical protein
MERSGKRNGGSWSRLWTDFAGSRDGWEGQRPNAPVWSDIAGIWSVATAGKVDSASIEVVARTAALITLKSICISPKEAEFHFDSPSIFGKTVFMVEYAAIVQLICTAVHQISVLGRIAERRSHRMFCEPSKPKPRRQYEWRSVY